MLRHPGYTRERIAQVGDRIRALIHADAVAPERLAVAGPVDRIEPAEAELLDYRDCELGEPFGPLWASYWFKVEATVPERWQGERVDLLWVSHSEATLWDGGRALQGLNTSPDGARVDAMLREAAAAGERLDLRVELACNGLFGELPRPYASREPVVLDRCQIARFDPRAWRLHHDFDVLRRLEAEHADGLDPTWAGELLYELNRVCNVWSEHDPATWDEAEAILAPLLERRNATVTHELSAIGHAHLDTAWLWPLAESYRKAVRSFSSQVAYMDRYPEFRFACSQAQQYDWIRRRNPELYGRIRARVESGQWLPVGGTWVEPDCNLPSGESLVRQFLHGQRYFEREFGRRCPRVLEPRRVRLQRPAAPDHARRRDRPVPHPEAVLEPVQPARPPHVHLAGDRRVAGARALPAGRHVQRHRRGGRASPQRPRLQGPRPLAPQPAGVRLRRRRRWADAGHAGDAAPRPRPAGPSAHDHHHQR